MVAVLWDCEDCEDSFSNPLEKKEKKVKKVKINKDEGIINIYKLKRGGNKTISLIKGFEYYTKDVKSLASKFGKKFSCGSAVA